LKEGQCGGQGGVELMIALPYRLNGREVVNYFIEEKTRW
jgi:hypothetical protein